MHIISRKICIPILALEIRAVKEVIYSRDRVANNHSCYFIIFHQCILSFAQCGKEKYLDCQILQDTSGIVLASSLDAIKKDRLYISVVSLYGSSSLSPFLPVTGLIFHVQSARSSVYLAGREENAAKPRCCREMLPPPDFGNSFT